MKHVVYDVNEMLGVKSRTVMGQLLDDARAAPWVAEAAFYSAALDLAQAGIATLHKS